MSSSQYLATLLTLLVAPGPTNTLLALGGAGLGLSQALRLIPAALAGYLCVIVPLALVGSRLFEAVPLARAGLGLAAAAWVAVLAVGLWRQPAPGAQGAVTAARVFITTLLNPKALVIGLVLVPAVSTGLPSALALLAGTVVMVAAAWVRMGALFGGRTGIPDVVRRGAALWLALLAFGIAAASVAG